MEFLYFHLSKKTLLSPMDITKKCFLIFILFCAAGYGQVESKSECNAMIEKGIALMFEKKHVQSLEILLEATAIAQKNDWSQQEFRAVLNTGSNYYLMSDFGEALEFYLKAYEIAIEHLQTKDELTVLNNIGILYFQESNLPKARDYFLKAYELSSTDKNSNKHGYYAINLALVSNKMNKAEDASRYIQEALPLVRDQPEIEIMAKMALAENLFIKSNYDQARERALTLLPQLVGDAHADNRVFVLLLIAQIYERQQNYQLALQYARRARAASKSLENREDVYEALSKAYISLRDYDSALRYKDSVIMARDTLQKIRNITLYENNKIKFEIQNYAHQLIESQLLLQKERRFFYSVVVFGLLLFVLALWIFRNHITKQKQRKKITELELEQEKSKRLLAEKQIREREIGIKLEQQRLKNELDLKNRKLTSKAVYLSSRNELIEEIVETLSANAQVKAQPELLSQLKALSKHLKNNPQFDSFFSHFEEVNPGFSTRLLALHPNLTQQDVRFIMYLYMNLGNNEIASLLNITPQSCRKRKERISKKLDLGDGKSLAVYITTI
tara:strand:- start:7003 stop:8679 length:1677 start_codon:yes stop_codon:yes gene_type:complete